MAGAGDAFKVRLLQPPASLSETPEELAWLSLLSKIVGASVSSGTTAQRPVTLLWAGRRYFDTSLNAGAGLPIFRNTANTAWINAAGTAV